MPIRQYLGSHRFDPETTRLMGIALETACQALRSQGVNDPPPRLSQRPSSALPEPANAIPTGYAMRPSRRVAEPPSAIPILLQFKAGPACPEATPRLPSAPAPLGVTARS